jgi:DNA-binding MarR family transcriptional regulator
MDILSFGTIADHIKKEINHKCDLNLSQTRILLYFDHTDNQQLTMGKLADGLHISLSTLSRQLQQHKTSLLVEIIKSEKDSSKRVHLNEAGLAKVDELKQVLQEITKNIFNFWDQDELQLFSTQLTMIAKKLTTGSKL